MACCVRICCAVLLTLLTIDFDVASAQLLGGAEPIDDLADPEVIAAANAAVQFLNEQNSPDSLELILLRILSGSQQVVNGIRYVLNVEIGTAMTCMNDGVASTSEQCPISMDTVNMWTIMVVASSGSPIMYTIENTAMVSTSGPPPGGKMIIQNFSDPRVVGAACAAAGQITAMSTSIYKSVVVVIKNGTSQVVNGLRLDLLIDIAISTVCQRDSELCTSTECPIDERTQLEWMASVIASPTVPPVYDVLSVSQVGGRAGGQMIIQNYTEPRVMGAACAAVDQITAMSNSMNKIVLVLITNGTFQVVNGIRYRLLIEVALSITCGRDSDLCTSMQCPIDDRTRSLWLADVVAAPTVPADYTVLSVTKDTVGDDGGGGVTTVPHVFFIAAISAVCLITTVF